MKKLTMKVIENARPGQDLLITDDGNGVIEIVWRPHEPFHISVEER